MGKGGQRVGQGGTVLVEDAPASAVVWPSPAIAKCLFGHGSQRIISRRRVVTDTNLVSYVPGFKAGQAAPIPDETRHRIPSDRNFGLGSILQLQRLAGNRAV